MKPYYRVKGKYKDNRKRIIIEQKDEKNKVIYSKAIPTPEKQIELMDTRFCPSCGKEILIKNGH